MNRTDFFFAGGGTGGHIYPAIAVAEEIIRLQPNAKIHFLCSSRKIDERILSKTNFDYTPMPATAFGITPAKIINFCKNFIKSSKKTDNIISKSANPAVIGVGGFASAGVCFSAHKNKVPIYLINTDIVPGKANKLLARWAKNIFVQFDDTAGAFGKYSNKVEVLGCPLRRDFITPQPDRAFEQLGLEKNKKILLITGASSGSRSINETLCCLLDKLAEFNEQWQIVHLAGIANIDYLKQEYAKANIKHYLLDYFDNMADLLAAADLGIGRAGAVSVAEFTASALPVICMPYPHHKDMHQYLNAAKLVEAGAAVIVDDIPDPDERAGWLWEELSLLLTDDDQRNQMRQNHKKIARLNAAENIAKKLLEH